MSDALSRIVAIRLGGKVERCHTIPHVGSYSVAAHSWGAAMLLREFWPEEFPHLVGFMLSHDVPEAWIGDLPSPLLASLGLDSRVSIEFAEDRILDHLHLPSLESVPQEDWAKIKACDRIELLLWCMEQEFVLGNLYVRECRRRLLEFIVENPPPEPARSFVEELRWRDPSALLPRQAGVVEKAFKGIL